MPAAEHRQLSEVLLEIYKAKNGYNNGFLPDPLTMTLPRILFISPNIAEIREDLPAPTFIRVSFKRHVCGCKLFLYLANNHD